MPERKGLPTGSENYSSPDVQRRVSSVLQVAQKVIDREPWNYSVSVGEINTGIPTLVSLSDRLKYILNKTPQREEVRLQIETGFLYVPAQSATVYIVKEPVKRGESLQRANIIKETYWEDLTKKALPEDILYSRLLQRAGSIVRLFAGDPPYLSPEIEPQLSEFAKREAEQRRGDRNIATQAVTKLLQYRHNAPAKFGDLCLNAAYWETVSQALGFPSEWRGDNLYRIMLEFYLKGMFDIDFQVFEPARERGSKKVGLRAHFLMKDGQIGCWAEWESKVRTFHEPDERCGTYTSFALNFWDKVRLAFPTGEDFNHQVIDRVS